VPLSIKMPVKYGEKSYQNCNNFKTSLCFVLMGPVAVFDQPIPIFFSPSDYNWSKEYS
jgi:hypothetical protein